MSGQMIELIIFAAIAFFVINKLISMLGTTDDDSSNGGSFFGEPKRMKDVTGSAHDDVTDIFGTKILAANFSKKPKINLAGLVKKGREKHIMAGLEEVFEKMPSFDLHKFCKGARLAFAAIIDAHVRNDMTELAELVDARYVDKFDEHAFSYGEITDGSKLELEICEIYVFGNSVFIKVLFSGKNMLSNMPSLSEEWTFTKSAIQAGNQWHLTNVDAAS